MTGIYLLYLIHHLIQPKIVSLFHKKSTISLLNNDINSDIIIIRKILLQYNVQ